MHPCPRQDVGQVRAGGDGVGLHILRLGLLQAGAEEVVHKVGDHIGGHHTDQELIGAEFRLGRADQSPHRRAGGEGAHQHQQKQQGRGHGILQGQGQGHRHDGAHEELALGADVEEIGLVGEGEGQGGEDQGRGLHQHLAQVVLVGDNLRQRLSADLRRIDIHKQQQARADQQSHGHRTGVIEQDVYFFPHCAASFSPDTPAISSPIWAVVSSPLR